jgi:glucosamine--fructose-6-phosphate aminotransferase (isomerizing)
MDHTLTICNVATSAMVRECAAYITRAGVEIGVASTKAFTTQLAALFLLTLALAKVRGQRPTRRKPAPQGHAPPAGRAARRAGAGAPDHRLGRSLRPQGKRALPGPRPALPHRLEGALKLKEISYIHAEAYPAGELKHGPLAW